ncbi:hypothetical protein [Nocardioides convexus]|uniref:hypothetical protein n=1 Tax=Nocardioides convexus TaxID=2712224 RepID=UPI0024188739|nr:hypothetical protein [Nocardioides convexus]
MGGHFVDAIGDLFSQSLSNWIQARASHTRGAVGRLAVLRARLGIAAHAQPQHVHPDRHGHRSGVAVQRGRHTRARDLPRLLSSRSRYGRRHEFGRGRCLLRSGGSDHRPRPSGTGPRACAPASRPRTLSAPSSI